MTWIFLGKYFPTDASKEQTPRPNKEQIQVINLLELCAVKKEDVDYQLVPRASLLPVHPGNKVGRPRQPLTRCVVKGVDVSPGELRPV